MFLFIHTIRTAAAIATSAFADFELKLVSPKSAITSLLFVDTNVGFLPYYPEGSRTTARQTLFQTAQNWRWKLSTLLVHRDSLSAAALRISQRRSPLEQ
ncbi:MULTISPECIES: hypothetical protein [Sphingopyxis]|uniref:hypothetical protein n=1 Tax=Sphingopyxis TaxID=165697 RepID=UPI001A1E367E|nr:MULTISPECIES: hypothetical protein [Sphingopyxis]MBJ7498221.1 hypothetical protein [Sphingopyxis sp.]HMO73920.1 hypothetical protein [Sphingopyxis sp.]HMP43477.1 hypothetical protein [Sphingopyxis sp.]